MLCNNTYAGTNSAFGYAQSPGYLIGSGLIPSGFSGSFERHANRSVVPPFEITPRGGMNRCIANQMQILIKLK